MKQKCPSDSVHIAHITSYPGHYPSARNRDIRPCGKACKIRCQKRYHPGNLSICSASFERYRTVIFRYYFTVLFTVAFTDRPAGSNLIDGYAEFSNLLGKNTDKPVKAFLGRCICRTVRLRQCRTFCIYCDETPIALLLHRRNELC